MKKHLTTILSYAMMMFVAFTVTSTLTSCGEEVIIDNPNIEKGKTVFSANLSDLNIDGTRTLLNKNRVYYWQTGDQIWVNDNGTWIKSSDSELSPDGKSANFYFDKLLTASSYQVVYTGYGSNPANRVKMSSTYSNISGNGYKGIGQNGDCGVATATRQTDGTYKFSLQHKASYLGIAPLNVSYLNKDYRWTKVEVTDVNDKPIAGTFGFSHGGGIDTTNVTSPSRTITMTADMTNLYTYLQSYSSDYDYNYTVLPPVHRKLNVKYYFVDNSDRTVEMTFTKQLKARKFIENNVVLFRHGITPDYYCWDAPKTEPNDGVVNIRNHNTAAPFTKATRASAQMPTPNEMAWYVMNGDPRWDNTTEWTTDGGASYHTGGVWIKKKAYITGFTSTAGPDGINACSQYKTYNNNSSTYLTGGKPSNTSQYFFLPALGSTYITGAQPSNMETMGYYWSSYSTQDRPTDNVPQGYALCFDSNFISLGARDRSYGCITGNGTDWFK